VAAKTGGILISMSPPNLTQSRLLCQSIASGLLDNVALLAPPGSIPSDHPYSVRLAYIGCTNDTKEPLFMDRNSVLFTRDYRKLPQWVCYESLQRKTLRDGRTVSIMKNLTPVDPSWLCFLAKGSHILSIGEALQSPVPTYDESEDMIMCSVKTKYGSHGWEIPCLQQSMALSIANAKGKKVFTEDDLYRWFGRYLLEGKIFAELKSLEHMLNDPPTVITRKISSSKVIVLVAALSRHGIRTRQALIQHWTAVDDKFLFAVMKKWIRPERAADFKTVWINLVKSRVSRG
jgi:Oligonucleotide/oligosaccharide-binding (OB)-fold